MLVLLPFDNVLPGYFLCLIARRLKRLPFRRINPCLRFLHALPLGDTNSLGRLSNDRNDLFPRTDELDITAGGFSCLPDRREVRVVKETAINHFGLGDEVSFRLGLSVKSL